MHALNMRAIMQLTSDTDTSSIPVADFALLHNDAALLKMPIFLYQPLHLTRDARARYYLSLSYLYDCIVDIVVWLRPTSAKDPELHAQFHAAFGTSCVLYERAIIARTTLREYMTISCDATYRSFFEREHANFRVQLIALNLPTELDICLCTSNEKRRHLYLKDVYNTIEVVKMRTVRWFMSKHDVADTVHKLVLREFTDDADHVIVNIERQTLMVNATVYPLYYCTAQYLRFDSPNVEDGCTRFDLMWDPIRNQWKLYAYKFTLYETHVAWCSHRTWKFTRVAEV